VELEKEQRESIRASKSIHPSVPFNPQNFRKILFCVLLHIVCTDCNVQGVRDSLYKAYHLVTKGPTLMWLRQTDLLIIVGNTAC
jgi:ribosomal protein L44E